MIVIYLLSGFAICALITRPFTVFFHELGHALSFFLFTGSAADIYIGSYGDKDRSFRIALGRTNIWFRKNPLHWQYGLCDSHAHKISLTGSLVSTLAGVLFSLLAASLFAWLAFTYDWHGLLKLLLLFAVGSALFDIFVNLYPGKIHLKDGRVLDNDGKILADILRWKRWSRMYQKGIQLFQKEKYEEAERLFESIWTQGFKNEATANMIAYSQIFAGDHDKAMQTLHAIEQQYGLTLQTHLTYSLFYQKTKNVSQEKTHLLKIIELEPSNTFALNNLGYRLLCESRFQEAIPYLDKAIEYQPDFAFALNNRGLAKIAIDLPEEGIIDIEHSISLDSSNSYGYRNKGIYFLQKKELDKALEYLLKAREIDPETEDLEYYLALVRAEADSTQT
ncbi:MAG: M50 family metallopeptidase [Chitinophagaceae bacterium]|nr:M50 family metallopeptidase [Chitinophagaceae bacterium]